MIQAANVGIGILGKVCWEEGIVGGREMEGGTMMRRG